MRVVVIGAGIVGTCCALYLQRDGHAVTLLDPHGPGGHASSSNAGWIATAGVVPIANPGVLRDVPRLLTDPLSPLAIPVSYLLAIAPWLVRFALSSRPKRVEAISRALTSLIEQGIPAYEPLLAEIDADGLVHRNGALSVYGSEAAFASAKKAIDMRRRRGIEFRVLEGNEAREIEPTLQQVHRAVWYPKAFWTSDPGALVRRLADRFAAGGGNVVLDQAVGFRHERQRPVAVFGRHAEYAFDRIVVAGGAWSRPLALALGDRVPLDTERGYVVVLPEAGVRPRTSVVFNDHHVVLTPMNGGLRLSGMNELGGVRTPANPVRARKIVDAARHLYPQLSATRGRWWMSYRPSMPDSLPVIGVSSRHPAAIYAFGHGHSGLGMAAITGRLVADLVAERPTSIDLAPYSPRRFALHSLRAPILGRTVVAPQAIRMEELSI